jgi:hypothetical protein
MGEWRVMTPPPKPPEPRKPGRPKADEPGIVVSTWVRESTYDRLARYALKHDQSLSALLRESLAQRFPLK